MHNRFRWIRVRRATFGAALIGILAIAPAANARVTQINITTVESPTFGGASFGSVGQYERIEGTITGAVDRRNPPNAVIADIAVFIRRSRPTRNAVNRSDMRVTLDALSDLEIDELDSFLESDVTPGECMDITALDGFLTAVTIGPGLPLPSVWMPLIWGGKDQPLFESAEQAHRIVSLIMRRMNMISDMLGQEPPAFEPVLYETELEGGGTVVMAHDWCAGFMAAVDHAVDDWQPLFDDESNRAFLVPFLKLGTDEGRNDINTASDPRAEYDQSLDLLEPCVLAIDAYWKLRWRKESTVLREAIGRPRSLRPGRNDPCPCGSQRKFKKCCAMRSGI